MINWLLDPYHAALITWVSFFVGALGTVFGLGGLGVALWQLSSIKSETEASRAAIESVQLKVASFDTIQECQSANNHISAIRNLLKNQEWDEIVSEYEELMENFLRLCHSNSQINDSDRNLIQKYTQDIANICEGIRKKSSQSSAPVLLRGQDKALRDFSDIVIKISFLITKELQR